MIATGLKLNLGGGDVNFPDFINVDLREDVADVVADVRLLPYEDGSVDAIKAFDLLEHFPETETESLLAEWRRVLRHGGKLELRVPNMVALGYQIYRRREEPGPCKVLIRNVYGGHRFGIEGSLDTHHTGFVPSILGELLLAAGFTNVTFSDELNMLCEAVAD
jgi:SAM-dependent methyltransferase